MSKTVLNGHTSQENAYIIEDYPYGRELRCQMKCWVETAEKGSKRGEQRFVTQTSNARRDNKTWNKPHPGIYSHMVVMYLDSYSGHVETAHLHAYGDRPEKFMSFKTQFYHQLTEDQQKHYNKCEQLSRAVNASSWKEFEYKLEELKKAIREHNHKYYTPAKLEEIIEERLNQWFETYLTAKEADESLKCCEYAKSNNCVCMKSRWCPVHGLCCVGSHD